MTKTEELLQSCIYQIVRENPFVGGLLQELTFKFNREIPTAAIGFNPKNQKYELLFNLDYFQKHNKNERIAILTHEILHFLHRHLFRWQTMNIKLEDRFIWNIAADMAINQYIEHLPEGTIDVKNYKQADGSPFPLYQTMEFYYDLIQKNRKPEEKGKEQKDKNGKSLKDKDGNPVLGTGNEGANKEELDKYTPFDEHNWDDLSDEEKERMAREAEKVIQRTIEKTSYSHSQVPGYVQDFLKELEGYLKKLNYKAILRAAIKKTVMSQDRDHTWKKPSKRYGVYAPGTTLSRIPNIDICIDSSGSMSYTEINQALDITDGFMKAGNKKCRLILWHTDVYYNKNYKLNNRLKAADVQQGGTDPLPTLELLKKRNSDLAIIITDGFYSKSDIKLATDIIWIITPQGNKDHPNKHIGKTILLDGLK